MSVNFNYHNHEVNPQMATIVSPTEVVVVSTFHVELDGGGGDIQVVYPYSMIEPIRNLLDTGVQSDRGDIDERWAILLKEELMHAKIDMQALFVEKQVPLSDLINFRAGDIIPIDLPEQVMVLAEELPIIRGQFGEHQGNAAVKVEEIIEIYDPENEDIKNAITHQE
jgi:flagellar motor switch protein FliM